MGMTIKEISTAFRVSTRTISRAVKELFPGLMKKGVTTILTESQGVAIGEVVRKKGFVNLGQKSKELNTNVEVDKIDRLIDGMNNLAAAINSQVQANSTRIDQIESRFKAEPELLPAPQMLPRARLRKVVSGYATKNDISYRDAWNELYSDFFYRCGKNIKLLAKNRNLSPIDYAEQNGMIGDLLSIAIKIMGELNEKDKI